LTVEESHVGEGFELCAFLPEVDFLTLLGAGNALQHRLKTTRYFEEQVLRKRPYLKREWCERAVKKPLRRERQADGRIRAWVFVPELQRYLRVVIDFQP